MGNVGYTPIDVTSGSSPGWTTTVAMMNKMVVGMTDRSSNMPSFDFVMSIFLLLLSLGLLGPTDDLGPV